MDNNKGSLPEPDSLQLPLNALTVLFVVGLFPMPYGYYTILKIAVCYVLYLFFTLSSDLRKANPIWHYGTIGLFVLYNPLIPVHLGSKGLWTVVNIAALVALYSMLSCLVAAHKVSALADKSKNES